MNLLKRILLWSSAAYLLLCCLTACVQRRLIFFPTHEDSSAMARHNGLREWRHEGAVLGFVREVAAPRHVWLYLHGNAGQAVDRAYALQRFDPRDSVYILEYPGYGARPGKPTQDSLNRAAAEAYSLLQRQHPGRRLRVLGESLGSGPSCHLATLPNPPARLVLVVPFDRIVDVAQGKMRFLPVRLLMLDRWDNIQALQGFKGRLDVYGASRDVVIPVQHARALAASVPGSRYVELDCEHNAWPVWREVDLGD